MGERRKLSEHDILGASRALERRRREFAGAARRAKRETALLSYSDCEAL